MSASLTSAHGFGDGGNGSLPSHCISVRIGYKNGQNHMLVIGQVVAEGVADFQHPQGYAYFCGCGSGG
jgi:hypothetical protein